MHLCRLRLFQFRCHGELRLELGPGRHIFQGANGLGKTSILEAIHFLSRLRSWRSTQARDLIARGGDRFRVEAGLAGAAEGAAELAVTWSPGGRQLVMDGQPVSRLADFWGRLPVVLMVGDDRDLVAGAGAGRRAWADALLAQRTPGYLTTAQHYARALKQRNAWLRAGGPDPRVGESLTRLVTEHGLAVTRARSLLTQEVAPAAAACHRRLAPREPALEIAYRPSFSHPAGSPVAPDWPSLAAQELRQQTTLMGPHRDDWQIALGGQPLARFGSEGQQRTAALALRLAEAELVRQARGYPPILLMDDVTPQLDAQRQAALREELPSASQIFMTTPEARDRGPDDCVWNVAPGRAERRA